MNKQDKVYIALIGWALFTGGLIGFIIRSLLI